MSVVSVRERWIGRGGKYTYSFTPNDSTTRTFRVKTNDINDDDTVIATSGQVPFPGDTHPRNLLLRVKDLDIKQVNEHPNWWDVTVTYTDVPEKPPQDKNPLNRAARIRMRSVRYQRLITQDRDGNIILNSANWPLPPIEVENSHWSFEVEKNYPTNGVPGWVLTVNDSVNSDPFTISQLGLTIDENCAKISDLDLSDILAEDQDDGSTILYRTLRFVIDFDQNGFQKVLRDEGFYRVPQGEEDTSRLYLIKVKDANGVWVPAPDPQPLDGEGNVLPKSMADQGQFNYLTFDVYPQFDFSQLPLT